MSTTSSNDSLRDARLWRDALAHTALLSVLFVVVYGGTSWITSLRSDVGTWYYEWERMIPFVPLMIVPYMSIDLFFVAAPFLCQNKRELRIFSRRVVLAILIAGTCFLVYPLQLAVERPTIGGWLGALWEWFKGMDRPYNLLPSLHIALRTILADAYVRHSRGFLRLAVHAWFSLIGFSTLLTYQHHAVDIIGGFILATFCFYFVNEVPLRLPMVRNTRVGWKYAVLGILLAVACAATLPWGAVLLWPIVSVAIMTAGYFGLGPGIFRKRSGRLPFSARVVLAPALVGQYVSLLYYKRQCRSWDAIAPGVWIGRRLGDAEARAAVEQGVTAVIDLCGEFSEAGPFLQTTYFHIPVLDLTAPTMHQLTDASAFIEQHAATGIVYVHCKIGYSRSATIVGAWLLDSGRASTADDAISQLRAARPAIVIRPEVRETLLRLERRRSRPKSE